MLKILPKISFALRRNDLRTSVDVITIYTKQSTPLAADNSEVAVIGLSLKWRQLCVCTLTNHGFRRLKSSNELWLILMYVCQHLNNPGLSRSYLYVCFLSFVMSTAYPATLQCIVGGDLYIYIKFSS